MKNLLKKSGFTLIELIIVVAIIALLAAATFVAVNPARRIHEANDAQRWADVTAIADAWATYAADNSGNNATSSADCITANTTCMISNYAGTDADYGCGATTTNARIWLDPLVTSGYLGSIPADPQSTTAAATSTGYYFLKDANGVVTVGSCEPDYDGNAIKVIR